MSCLLALLSRVRRLLVLYSILSAIWAISSGSFGVVATCILESSTSFRASAAGFVDPHLRYFRSCPHYLIVKRWISFIPAFTSSVHCRSGCVISYIPTSCTISCICHVLYCLALQNSIVPPPARSRKQARLFHFLNFFSPFFFRRVLHCSM